MTCEHIKEIKQVQPLTTGCQECLETNNGKWIQLRLCQSCGHVGCCDSSKDKHANKHFVDTKHPIIKSFKSGDDWLWCYIDKDYI